LFFNSSIVYIRTSAFLFFSMCYSSIHVVSGTFSATCVNNAVSTFKQPRKSFSLSLSLSLIHVAAQLSADRVTDSQYLCGEMLKRNIDFQNKFLLPSVYSYIPPTESNKVVTMTKLLLFQQTVCTCKTHAR
jgi:hypothetical protein